MKVLVHARYLVTETIELDVDDGLTDQEISDKAWEVAYDYMSKYNTSDVYDVEWE